MDIFKRIDELLEENRVEEAETLMEQILAQAMMEQDRGLALAVLNEMVGFYRTIGNAEQSYYYGEAALAMLDDMDMKDTVPYATSLLNLATAYRAGGRLTDALKCYSKVEDIYEKELDPNDPLQASFCNNVSLLYQEMGDFNTAAAAQKKALRIMEKHPDKFYEIAVTNTNLANTLFVLQKEEEGLKCLEKALKIFEEHQITDSHYQAALSAMGTHFYEKGDYEKAIKCFTDAMEGIEKNLGRTESYERMKYNIKVCMEALEGNGSKTRMSGMELAQSYYETYGKKMIHEKFSKYEGRIAVGLCGEGSECFGFDDEVSEDHDYFPSFCMFVTEDLYQEIGEKLQKAYDELPQNFMGYSGKNQENLQGKGRRGVQSIERFYERILGKTLAQQIHRAIEENDFSSLDLRLAAEQSLACVVNGKIFTDPLGLFTRIRKELQKGYKKNYQYLKLAQEVAEFTQYGLYNSKRMLKRKDVATAKLMIATAIMKGAHILYTVSGVYAPHDKWLLEGLKGYEEYAEVLELLRQAAITDETRAIQNLESIAEKLAYILYGKNYISDVDSYLDHHVEELLCKSDCLQLTKEELVDKIARMEFANFDKVKNEGSRASCQDDWFTFSIMRKSQYYTFDLDMLCQYYYDFERESKLGHNLIEEKYGRMMESTAPEKYEEIKHHFPALSQEKKNIIEEIVKIQVEFMEEFAEEYPLLAGNARSIHTYEDHAYNTSYETYLRGELGTYSDKMLELYGKYIVRHVSEKKNLAKEIMEYNVKMYGYESLEEAEQGLD